MVAAAIAQQLHEQFDSHVGDEFEAFQEWMTTDIFEDGILPAMMMMTEQLSTIAIHQVEIIGMFLDAKHQLETQRLIQELTAQAHKDYHPSEGLCVVGTNTRSLAASDRAVEYNTIVISNRTMQRQQLAGDVLSATGRDSDRLSRLDQFRDVYCDVNDNGFGLLLLCQDSGPAERQNKDIDFTSTIETPLTLDLDFAAEAGANTADEEDVFALAANLFANEVPPQIPESFLSDADGNPIPQGAEAYMDLRSVMAKRSVAQNSFASITAQKSAGAQEVQPFMYAMLEDMGLPEEEIVEILGERPSYFAQMEMLTKKMYQHPNFYSELYDKPVNVRRKLVAMQAIDLMQKRDSFRSLLRSEAVLSVLLEMAVMEEQDRVRNEMNGLEETGSLFTLP